MFKGLQNKQYLSYLLKVSKIVPKCGDIAILTICLVKTGCIVAETTETRYIEILFGPIVISAGQTNLFKDGASYC